MVGGAIYRAELAMNLRDLGYEIDRTHADGRFEVNGFTKEQLGAFSQRRSEIEAALAERGLESARAAEVAALETRERKRDVDRTALRHVWRDRARAMGMDLKRPAPKARGIDRTRDAGHAARAVQSAIDHLSERRSVFFEREVIAKSAAFGVGKARVLDLGRELHKARRTGVLVEGARSERELGKRYTTKEALTRERALLALMKLGQGELDPILEPEDRARFAEGNGLTQGQRQAVELVLSTTDRVVGIQGYAGTGKTTALSAIKEAAESGGLAVRGFAATRAAADLLGEVGIESTTLADHLVGAGQRSYELSLEVGAARGPRELWILDESSLLGTRDALAFLRAAETKNARVVLVGDRAQLPAIEAGKPFALLVDRGLETATMREIKRQKETLKTAVQATIDRDLNRAISILKPNIHEVSSKPERIDATARAYLETAPALRDKTLVLTASNADRRALNEKIREGLEREGKLRGSVAHSTVLVKKHLTKVEARHASSYREGDIVRFSRRYKRLGAEKGEYAHVVQIDVDANLLELRRMDGLLIQFCPAQAKLIEVYSCEERTLRAGDRIRFTRNDRDRSRANGGEAVVVAVDVTKRRVTIDRGGRHEILELDHERHWDHAYVRTVYSAQGRTAERAILHIDNENQKLVGFESFYVGLSRARSSVAIYTDNAAALPAAIRREMTKEAAVEFAPTHPAIASRDRTGAVRLGGMDER
jgi:ATP-dependent exoDNAse (exonuclease V) alpha subunit